MLDLNLKFDIFVDSLKTVSADLSGREFPGTLSHYFVFHRALIKNNLTCIPNGAFAETSLQSL